MKRRRVSLEDSDDEFGLDAATQAAMLEEGMFHGYTISGMVLTQG